MDNWGQTMPRIGVVDEYKVEYKEMLERYPHIRFDKSEYIIKSMLVSIDPEIKQLFNDNLPARPCLDIPFYFVLCLKCFKYKKCLGNIFINKRSVQKHNQNIIT